MSQTDTIAAIATARGRAALAVVRTSGPEAVGVVDRCFRGEDLTEVESHTAHVGVLKDEAGADIDQVIVTVFRAPNSAIRAPWSRRLCSTSLGARSPP